VVLSRTASSKCIAPAFPLSTCNVASASVSQCAVSKHPHDNQQPTAAQSGPGQVKVFKGHPAGVVSVRFRTQEGAQEALARMGGRFFGGRRIAAALWDGLTNYNVKVR